jgi:DNA-binding MarR family transcriptional regulator
MTRRGDVEAEESAGLGDFLTALADLHAAWRRRFDASANEQLVLECLAERGPLTPKELSAHLDVTTGGISTMLDRLQERGLTHRTTHHEDRRRVLVQLTKKGLRTRQPYQEARAQLSTAMERMAARDRVVVEAFLAAAARTYGATAASLEERR